MTIQIYCGLYQRGAIQRQMIKRTLLFGPLGMPVHNSAVVFDSPYAIRLVQGLYHLLTQEEGWGVTLDRFVVSGLQDKKCPVALEA